MLVKNGIRTSRCTETAYATVIDCSESRNIPKQYYAEIEYTVNGKTYRKQDTDGGFKKYKINSEVKIKYNPKNPSEFILSKITILHVWIIFMLGANIPILILILMGKIKPKAKTEERKTNRQRQKNYFEE